MLLRRLLSLATPALVLGSLTVAPASAAATVGSTFAPNYICLAGNTLAQTTSPPGTSYAVAGGGVVTSWRFQASATPVPQLKLKVFRAAGDARYTVIGESQVAAPVASTTSTFPVRIPVRAGDVIGLTLVTSGNCHSGTGSWSYVKGDPAVGSTLAYTAEDMGTLDVAAVVEPDADGDGYGDETQDACPSQRTTPGACDTTAPDTQFSKGPTRTRKTKASFAFTATEAGSSFECRITGKHITKIQLKTFQPCTSPITYKKLKPGRYQVYVQATDAVGNVDASPATVRLKVLPRR